VVVIKWNPWVGEEDRKPSPAFEHVGHSFAEGRPNRRAASERFWWTSKQKDGG
jgi:hypothetical protein